MTDTERTLTVSGNQKSCY